MRTRKRKASAQQRALELFTLYEQKMYAVAFAILHDEGQAEDAVMDAFEKLLRANHIPEDARSDHAKRLVIAAVRSCAIDQYRRNAREHARTAPLPDDPVLSCAAAIAPPADEALEHDAAQALLDRLPAAYRDVVHDRILEERSVADTSAHLGISEQNVRKRQERALRKLREQLSSGAASPATAAPAPARAR